MVFGYIDSGGVMVGDELLEMLVVWLDNLYFDDVKVRFLVKNS